MTTATDEMRAFLQRKRAKSAERVTDLSDALADTSLAKKLAAATAELAEWDAQLALLPPATPAPAPEVEPVAEPEPVVQTSLRSAEPVTAVMTNAVQPPATMAEALAEIPAHMRRGEAVG